MAKFGEVYRIEAGNVTVMVVGEIGTDTFIGDDGCAGVSGDTVGLVLANHPTSEFIHDYIEKWYVPGWLVAFVVEPEGPDELIERLR